MGTGGGASIWAPPPGANARALAARDGGSIGGLTFEADRYRDCVLFEGPPGTVVEISDASFQACRDGVRLDGDVDAIVSNSLFVDSVFGIIGVASGELSVLDSEFVANYIAVTTDSHVPELSGSDFRHNDNGFYGEIKAASVSAPTSAPTTAALSFEIRTGNGAPDTWIRDNVFVDNVDSHSYGAGGMELVVRSCADFDIHVVNNTFAGNGGSYATHLYVPTTGTDLWNNGFGKGRAGAAGVTAGNYIFACPVTTRGDYNLFFRNDGGHLDNLPQARLGSHTLWGVAPMVTSYTRNQVCDDDFTPLPGSPLIDGGDPASPTDPDGSRADIGSRYP